MVEVEVSELSFQVGDLPVFELEPPRQVDRIARRRNSSSGLLAGNRVQFGRDAFREEHLQK